MLTERQLDVLREATRVRRLVSVVQHPGGRLEDVAASGWEVGRVALPTDAEVRQLVRDGYLEKAGPSVATSFYVTEAGRLASKGMMARPPLRATG